MQGRRAWEMELQHQGTVLEAGPLAIPPSLHQEKRKLGSGHLMCFGRISRHSQSVDLTNDETHNDSSSAQVELSRTEKSVLADEFPPNRDVMTPEIVFLRSDFEDLCREW
jgi:hypothetical protein